jgi:hypothetical protein
MLLPTSVQPIAWQISSSRHTNWGMRREVRYVPIRHSPGECERSSSGNGWSGEEQILWPPWIDSPAASAIADADTD